MKNVPYYRSLPYKRKADLRNDDGHEYFIAWVAEIPALRIHGDSRLDALKKLDEIFDDVIESMIELGEDIPEPQPWPQRFPGTMDSSKWGLTLSTPIHFVSPGQSQEKPAVEIKAVSEEMTLATAAV